MKNTIRVIIFYCLLVNCSSIKIYDLPQRQDFQVCNEENALLVSDYAIEKTGYKLETLHTKVTENDSLFFIYYYPKSLNRRGGDVNVKVSKKTCKVIDIVYSQ